MPKPGRCRANGVVIRLVTFLLNRAREAGSGTGPVLPIAARLSPSARAMRRRTAVPSAEDRISTRSHNWLTSHNPRPSGWRGSGGSRPTSGSSMCPASRTSHTSAAPSVQTRRRPPPPPWRTLFDATSDVAMTIASTCSASRPCAPAVAVTTVRTSRSDATSKPTTATGSGGSGNGTVYGAQSASYAWLCRRVPSAATNG